MTSLSYEFSLEGGLAWHAPLSKLRLSFQLILQIYHIKKEEKDNASFHRGLFKKGRGQKFLNKYHKNFFEMLQSYYQHHFKVHVDRTFSLGS